MKHKWLFAGLLLLVELGLAAGMAAIVQATFAQPGLQWHAFQFNTVLAETTDEQRFALNGPATLVVDNSHGQVTVQRGADSEIVIRAHKQAWGPSQAEAQAALAALKPAITQEGNTVTAKYAGPMVVGVVGSYSPPTVDWTITVPASTSVTAHVRFGGITLSGTAGNAELTADRGALRVSGAEGKLHLDSNYGDVTAERITGKLQATSQRGSLSLKDIRVDGALIVSTDYGSIRVSDSTAGSLEAAATRGYLNLTALTLRGLIKARSDYGSLVLNQVAAASYDLQSKRGSISVDGVRGPIAAQSDYGSIDVKNGQAADLDLRANRGSITYAGSLGPGPHALQTEYGSIRLFLPEESALTVDLSAARGKITSDLAIAATGVVQKTHWSGTVGGGGAPLRASSTYGNISLDVIRP